MRKTLLITLISIFTLTATHAQDIKFGAKAGVNFATFTGDALTGFDTRVSFHIGGLAEIPLTENFSFQPELLYSEKGSEFFTSIDLSYLDIPLMAKYQIIKGLSAELGPVPSILLRAQETKRDVERDVTEFTKTFDLGIGGGVSYELPMGVFFGLRFTKGLMKISQPEKSENPDSQLNVQNNVFQVSAGYMF